LEGERNNMTIKYLDSKRVSGVASDTKPTDVQDSSIYIETDTNRRYWFETATAPTFEDDFSSDNWTDTSFTGVSGGVLTGDLIRNNTNHGAERAITALDNAAWVMRFKLIINTKATGENNSVALGISQTGTTGINASRYGLGVGLSQYHNKFRLVYPANQTWYQAVVHTAGSDPVPDTGTYYIELKRTSTTSVTLNIFSDSDYSTNIATVTQTISSGINALDNLCVQGMNDNGSGGTWNISIDDLKIYDGVTSIIVRDTKPTNVQDNSIYIETDTANRFWYDGSSWLPRISTRGICAGGYINQSSSNIMEYITIATTGNSTDFGDLTVGRYGASGTASATRGVFGGGYASGNSNVMDYVTIATTGNATDFGDLTQGRSESPSHMTNRTRGIFGMGYSTNQTMDYITIDTTGNASDFGDGTQARYSTMSCSNETRGLTAGGRNGSTTYNIIDYVTIATLGNATDFGDLSAGARRSGMGLANATRGVFAGGSSTDIMDYVTIATTGNATDFGDLLESCAASGSAASNTRGVWFPTTSHAIQYITIDTTGNATDFGDFTHTNTGIQTAGLDG